eukprot:EG_transcript_39061
MREISEEHLLHCNNHVPHFPKNCPGSVDTVPIFVCQGPHRYQPKYSHSVVKFQCVVTHLGFLAFLSGPHPGAMSDTTLFRQYRPNLPLLGLQDHYLLADLAYLSVPNSLPPIKGNNLTPEESEFNRCHQFYRARCEQYFAEMHSFAVVSATFRGSDLKKL